jgi:hypothetical protein
MRRMFRCSTGHLRKDNPTMVDWPLVIFNSSLVMDVRGRRNQILFDVPILGKGGRFLLDPHRQIPVLGRTIRAAWLLY